MQRPVHIAPYVSPLMLEVVSICISSYPLMLEKILYLSLDKYFASSGMVDMYQEGFTKN